jgi:hypothetical protein
MPPAMWRVAGTSGFFKSCATAWAQPIVNNTVAANLLVGTRSTIVTLLRERSEGIHRGRARLERDGHDSLDSKRLLGYFEELQNMHIAHRDRLEKTLAEITK